ncbi:hypothetical protein C8J56DRAFT_899246 [Mycena floridula]|nr:hypothetical protein C8J56DRAFT_899246 [Mycena floridula]
MWLSEIEEVHAEGVREGVRGWLNLPADGLNKKTDPGCLANFSSSIICTPSSSLMYAQNLSMISCKPDGPDREESRINIAYKAESQEYNTDSISPIILDPRLPGTAKFRLETSISRPSVPSMPVASEAISDQPTASPWNSQATVFPTNLEVMSQGREPPFQIRIAGDFLRRISTVPVFQTGIHYLRIFNRICQSKLKAAFDRTCSCRDHRVLSIPMINICSPWMTPCHLSVFHSTVPTFGTITR